VAFGARAGRSAALRGRERLDCDRWNQPDRGAMARRRRWHRANSVYLCAYTNVHTMAANTAVNVETDILAKYVETLMAKPDAHKSTQFTAKKLIEEDLSAHAGREDIRRRGDWRGSFRRVTAYRLCRAGVSVALIDSYGPANARASSGGESRIIRMGYGADEIYTRWSMQSLPM